VHSQGCTYNPTGHPVRSQTLTGIHWQSFWSPCAFTGMHLQSHWDLYAFTDMHPQTTPQSRCPPQPFPPIPGSMFWYYISYKRQHGSACVVAGCGVPSSGSCVALWPTCVVLFRYISIPIDRCEVQSYKFFVPLWPTCVVLSRDISSPFAGPVWSSLAQDLHGSGRHESYIDPQVRVLNCCYQ